jgi:O-antigen/teichoic acid export membrane protein
MLPVFTTYFNSEQYGLIDITNTLVLLLVPIISLNITEGVFRFLIGKKNIKEKKILVSSCNLIILFSIVVYLFIIPLFLNNTKLEEYSIFISFILIVELIFLYLNNIARGTNSILLFSLMGILRAFSFGLFGIILVVVYHYSLNGYFSAIIISYIFPIIILLFRLNKIIIDVKFNTKVLKKVILYTLPLIPNMLSWWIMNLSDRLIIISILGYSSAGIYAVAYKFPNLFKMIYTIFNKAWQISAVENFNKEDNIKYYSKIFEYLSIITIFFGITFSFILKKIVFIMTGSEFHVSWNYIPFLIMGIIFSIFSSFYGSNYVASKKTLGAFITSFFGAIVNLFINFILIPIIGIQAASFSTMVAFFTMWMLRVINTKKILPLKVSWAKLSSNIIMVFISLLANYINNYSFIIQLITLNIFVILNRKNLVNIFKKIISIIKNYKNK